MIKKMNDKAIEERNEIFDSAVREQVAGYEPVVPHALWNRISSQLDGETGVAAEETAMPGAKEIKSSGTWKMAVAAAFILTLGIGTLLYTLNASNQINTASSPVAVKSMPAAGNAKPEVSTPVKATETKMVAQSAPVVHPAIAKTIVPVAVKKEEVPAVAVQTSAPTPVENIAPAKTTPDQTAVAEDLKLEFTPATTQNKPMEVGNIPLASLNFLSTPSAVNDDEITIIKSTEKKKRHAKKNEETKVIMIGKRFESRPDIRYQVPARF